MDSARQLSETLRDAIADQRVLAAMQAVPRACFVPIGERSRAYDNVALPIDCGQTISQPIVVGRMLELLELAPGDHVLDVGTGSGYHAALLSHLAGHVWSIERHPALSEQAAAVLAELGIDNVACVVGDGSQGLADQAPFDAINLAAATGRRTLARLEAQLADGGRLIGPVGGRNQRLVLCIRTADRVTRQRLDPVRFVPLVPGPA